MSSSLILTHRDFQPESWKDGINNLTISSDSGATQNGEWDIIWVHTSFPEWASVTEESAKLATVISLTNELSLAEMQTALSSGAKAYLESMATPETLKQVATSVKMGALWIPPSLLGGMMNTLSRALPPKAENLDKLTPREQEVARVAIKGLSNKEIARELNITERTVKEHMSSIFAKLEIRDRMQLMLELS